MDPLCQLIKEPIGRHFLHCIMANTLALRALVSATLLSVLVPFSLASDFQYNQTRYGVVNVTAEQDIYAAEAAAMIEPGDSVEGEDHGDVDVPDGANFTSFKVNENGNEEMPGFITEDIDEKKLQHLFIVLHGKLRDGNDYWEMLTDAIKEAKDDNFTGTNRTMAVLAPQFFSKKYNSGQYSENQLAWDDLNAWEPGSQANHPDNTTLTAFDVLDGLVKIHADKEKYPSLKNITVVGHGGGGQLAQRYSAVAQDPPANVHVRYIHGDPSSCMYFTEDRPILSDNTTSVSKCPDFHTWRYGFKQFPGTKGKSKTPKEYFKSYVSRDVVSIVGLKDTGGGGDTSCMALVQGGINRRDRNLVWYRYINTLARTDEDLDGFPGSFDNLPDWSHAVGGKSLLRLVVVKDADHNATEVFESDVGRATLFNDGDIEEGWRPGDDDDDDSDDDDSDDDDSDDDDSDDDDGDDDDSDDDDSDDDDSD